MLAKSRRFRRGFYGDGFRRRSCASGCASCLLSFFAGGSLVRTLVGLLAAGHSTAVHFIVAGSFHRALITHSAASVPPSSRFPDRQKVALELPVAF